MVVEMCREQFENMEPVSVREDWMKIWQLSDWKSGLNINSLDNQQAEKSSFKIHRDIYHSEEI